MHLEEQVLRTEQLEEEVVEDWRGSLRPGDTCKVKVKMTWMDDQHGGQQMWVNWLE